MNKRKPHPKDEKSPIADSQSAEKKGRIADAFAPPLSAAPVGNGNGSRDPGPIPAPKEYEKPRMGSALQIALEALPYPPGGKALPPPPPYPGPDPAEGQVNAPIDVEAQEAEKKSDLFGFRIGIPEGSATEALVAKELHPEMSRLSMEFVHTCCLQETEPGPSRPAASDGKSPAVELKSVGKPVLENFGDEKQKENFPDLIFKTCDRQKVFFHRYLIMRSDLTVLKASLSGERTQAQTVIELNFPAWAVNAALNALTGKELTDWGLLIAALQILNRYGSTSIVSQLVARLETQPPPWPLNALERIYEESKLGVGRLAAAWLRSPSAGRLVVDGAIGLPPTEKFWKACETVPSPRFENVVRYFLPKHDIPLILHRQVIKHVTHAAGPKIEEYCDIIREMASRWDRRRSVAKFAITLALHAVGSEKIANIGSYVSPFRE